MKSQSLKLSYLVHSNKLTQTLLHLNDKLTRKVIGIALPCESSVREVGAQGSHIPDQTGLQSETQFQKERKERKKHLFWLELIILVFVSLILSFAIEKKKNHPCVHSNNKKAGLPYKFTNSTLKGRDWNISQNRALTILAGFNYPCLSSVSPRKE